MKCDRCDEQNAQTYHRVARGNIWIVYICGECFAATRSESPAIRRACPLHHSTSCGCPATTEDRCPGCTCTCKAPEECGRCCDCGADWHDDPTTEAGT